MLEGELPNAYGWLIAGAVLLGLEAFGIPGIGFLFAGLAAIIVGLLVHLEVIDAYDWLLQAGIFCAFTTLFALLLWKKLKEWRINPNAPDQYNNIVGDMATIGKGGIRKGIPGQASWSGTTMTALIDPGVDADELPEGMMVTITAVKGTQLFVAPASDSE